MLTDIVPILLMVVLVPESALHLDIQGSALILGFTRTRSSDLISAVLRRLNSPSVYHRTKIVTIHFCLAQADLARVPKAPALLMVNWATTPIAA